MTRWRDPLPQAPAGSFWASLDTADRRALAEAGTLRRLSRGTVLIREGQLAEQVWMLLTGQVEVFRDTPTGRRTTLSIHRAGDVIAEVSAIDGGPSRATARALENGSALVLPAARFSAICQQRPSLGWLVTTALMHRLRVSEEKRVRQRVEVRDRTVLALLDLAAPSTGPATVRITQQALADLVSASLVSVTRALEELRQVGAVATRRGRIDILDVGRLRAQLPPELR